MLQTGDKSRRRINLHKYTCLPYIVIYTWINLLNRVHKSGIFTIIPTTNFEMHKGYKSYLKYVKIVIGFSNLITLHLMQSD
jgi:hypothetical protein